MDIPAANKIADLRRRVAQNVQDGKLPYDGIAAEELKGAIDALRSNRSVASSRGGAANAAKKKTESKVAKAAANPSNKLKDLLSGLED